MPLKGHGKKKLAPKPPAGKNPKLVAPKSMLFKQAPQPGANTSNTVPAGVSKQPPKTNQNDTGRSGGPSLNQNGDDNF